MTEPVIRYDKDLPEVPDHNPYRVPAAYLIKNPNIEEGYEVVNGRRPSQLLLVNNLREAVGKWREKGYTGASEVTTRLFNYWFEEDHLVNGEIFRYYFAQREVLETIAYLIEVKGEKDIIPILKEYGEIHYPDGSQKAVDDDWKINILPSGERKVERFFPEIGAQGQQDLPSEDLCRYAVKMATGSGKTIVMAMTLVWSHFHKLSVPDSPLSSNFLILAPNVIVYQRLQKDFDSNKVFHELPLVPPEWPWNQKVILRGDSAEPDPSCNLFLTNIQQIYESRDREWQPENPIEAILGRKPSQDLASHERSTLERLKSLENLVIMNDEAHHVHDEDLEWNKTIMAIHDKLPSGLNLWLDFTATPKFQDGSYYPWCIVDYPLAQAVEDRIVKAPIIVHRDHDEEKVNVTRTNIHDVYRDWVVTAVDRYRHHEKEFKKLGIRPVLFVMCENTAHADALGKWIIETQEFKFREDEVLIIHTDSKGEITKGDLEKAREVARDIDERENKVKVLVSVMMLREGWDVKNVSVILGLRPFTAKANILPEQAVGRGLRLMRGVSPDRTQTLEIIGNEKFETLVRELEKEGVGVETVSGSPSDPIMIEPLANKIEYDITLPMTEPIFHRQFTLLDDLDPLSLAPIFEQHELDERLAISIRATFATTDTEVHQERIFGPLPESQEILSSLVGKVVGEAKLSMAFKDLYPKVRDYVRERCFGQEINLEDEVVRSHLSDVILQEGIVKYLARVIGHLTVQRTEITFQERHLKLADTKPFQWRRDLTDGPLSCAKTIFNYIATYNPYERRFAQFLNACSDIARFASLGSTQQGDSGAQFRVDYIKPSGAIGFYHPDFVAVQMSSDGDVHWIIETKGRVWEDTEAKDRAMDKWCKDISDRLDEDWRYIRINQPDFRDAMKQGVNIFEGLIRWLEDDEARLMPE